MKILLELESTNNYFVSLQEQLKKSVNRAQLENTEAFQIWGQEFAESLLLSDESIETKISISELQYAATKHRAGLFALLLNAGFLSDFKNEFKKLDKTVLRIILMQLSFINSKEIDVEEFKKLAALADANVVDLRSNTVLQ